MKKVLLFIIILIINACSSSSQSGNREFKKADYAQTAVKQERSRYSKNKVNAVSEISDVKEKEDVDYLKMINSKDEKIILNKMSFFDDEDKQSKITSINLNAIVRMVIYKGEFIIAVNGVKDSLALLESWTQKYEGFIDSVQTSDSYKQARITIRVPALKFEDYINELKLLGDIQSKKISSEDVTEQFKDNQLRLNTQKAILKRLESLLKVTRIVKDRIKILKEIERVTVLIQQIEERQKFLKDQADFSTIIIELKVKIQEQIHHYQASPFIWINNLSPEKVPDKREFNNISYSTPEGLFDLKKEYKEKRKNFLLFSPGNKVKIRISTIDNYPKADIIFWKNAIHIDFENRKLKAVENSIVAKNFTTGLYQVINNQTYLWAIQIKDDKILIVEALYKSPEIFNEYKELTEKFLVSIR